MGDIVQFPVATMIEKANREAARRDLESFSVPYQTPHEKALLHMELTVMNLIEVLDMPHQVLNTLPPEPCRFTYDQPLSADLFFSVLQSEIEKKRKELAQARKITNNHNETENYAAE